MLTGEMKTNAAWFSMAEWNEVYKNLYSTSNELKIQGYERLLVWRARVPMLPASIECTMGLIQVCLRDDDISEQLSRGIVQHYVENDLRLMYSTSLMRFLNHIATFAQNSDETLYGVAKKLYIPEWLVSLRHEAAHGFNLPSLDILRYAANIALEWLHENYWKHEPESIRDWIIPEELIVAEEIEEKIRELIDIWQALKLHSLAGYDFVGDVEDTELKEYMEDMKEENIKSCQQTKAKKQFKTYEMENGNARANMKLEYGIEMLMTEILKCIKNLSNKHGLNLKERLADIIVNRESFIPSAHSMWQLNNTVEHQPTESSLPLWLFMLWKDFIISLETLYAVLPQLVDRLIHVANDENECVHRRKLAALWSKELCQCLLKGQLLLKRVNQWKKKKNNVISMKLYKKPTVRTVSLKLKRKKIYEEQKIWELVNNELEEEMPILKGVPSLKMQSESGSICSMEALKDIVGKPSKFTHIFLPSLLGLITPPLPAATKENLVSLVNIYANDSIDMTDSEVVDVPIHTAQELISLECSSEGQSVTVVDDSEKLPSLSQETDPATSTKSSQWTRAVDHAWSECPLGVLPWQREKVPMFDMPKNVTWKPVEPASHNGFEVRNVTGLHHQKIDWPRAVRRSRRTERKILSKSLIKRAFDVLNK